MNLNLDGDLVLLGAGKMGGALLRGMLAHGLDPKKVIVQDPAAPDDIKAALAAFNISPQADPPPPEAPAAVILVAVKPQLIPAVLPKAVEKFANAETLIVSLAAGVTLAQLEAHAGANAAVVRTMPNTPAAIGHGMSVCCANANVRAQHRAVCETMLDAVGETAWIKDEAAMDAVTAVSGSGPAYVFLLAECLAQAGVKAGLDADLARQLAVQTVAGAGALLKAAPEDAATLRKNVTSPGGTTAAALDVLMADAGGMEELLEKAVAAAAKRSRELANG